MVLSRQRAYTPAYDQEHSVTHVGGRPHLSPCVLLFTSATQFYMGYCSFIDLRRMKGWVGLVGWHIADSLPTKWSPVSCKPSVGHGKSAGQEWRSTHCTTQLTDGCNTHLHFMVLSRQWSIPIQVIWMVVNTSSTICCYLTTVTMFYKTTKLHCSLISIVWNCPALLHRFDSMVTNATTDYNSSNIMQWCQQGHWTMLDTVKSLVPKSHFQVRDSSQLCHICKMYMVK